MQICLSCTGQKCKGYCRAGSRLTFTQSCRHTGPAGEEQVLASVALPAVPRDRGWLKRQVLMHEGNVRLTASFL